MAALVVTLTEALTLNGVDQGGTHAKTISSVTDCYKRIVTVPANKDTVLVQFMGEMDSGSSPIVDVDTVKYCRITNLGSNDLKLSLQISDQTGSTSSAIDASGVILVEAGKHFIMGPVLNAFAVDDDAATVITSLNSIGAILADSGSNAVLTEIFIAS